MPQYLTRKDNTYYFRQAVPVELRAIIGTREIRRSLGRDYATAVRECKRFAVTADSLIENARAQFDSIPRSPYSKDAIRHTRPVSITQFTPEIERQYANLIREALLETDRETRVAGLDSVCHSPSPVPIFPPVPVVTVRQPVTACLGESGFRQGCRISHAVARSC